MKNGLTSSKMGFTLIEMLVVFSIVVVLVTIGALPFIKFRQQQALQNTTNGVLSLVTRARAQTLSGTDYTFYSVKLESTQATLFKGGSYVSGAEGNEIYTFETPVTLGTTTLNGGGSILTFDRLRGTTSHHGTLQLQLPNSTTRTITITASGSVARN